jgi:shikimate dehydrogenase
VKKIHYHFGLTGYPLEHSLSPRIHTVALRVSNLLGEYKLYPVPPIPQGHGDLIALLDRIKLGELHGLNVTIPHKQVIMPLLDDLTPPASAIGAVNTIHRDGRNLIGDNTDGAGFRTDLGCFLAEINKSRRYTMALPKTALVLGAGGSARAVVYALVKDGWRVLVAARDLEQAQELSQSFAQLPDREAGELLASLRLEPGAIREVADGISLIVNTTPLGMKPQVNSSAWPSEVPLPPDAFVYDLVYNPPETSLVRAARAAGLPARTGLGMLIEQAALAFERWTGLSAPRQAMWESIYDE